MMQGYLHAYLDKIGPLIRDPAMIEVALNGDGRIWAEWAGEAVMREIQVPGLDADFARDLAKQIANDQSLSLNETAPMISASVSFEGQFALSGDRAAGFGAGHGDRAAPLPAPTFGAEPHRFGLLRDVKRSMEEERAATLGRLKAELSLGSEEAFDAFCREVVSKRLNVLISGITSGGKTELSRRLLWMVEPDQRLVLIQDANELLPDLPNVVSLIADRKESSVRSAERLLEATLRLRPDRIILGELRGIEAITFGGDQHRP
ncbi:ATPase, T2SS/T4P/T4SS family [Paracoccus cavernae]|uniref:ATPase, T2SS/T4P/T4SS family n=1 Tax=Paracoccus cavernae TaxID=1571207 RepID=A0ABT8DH81_9RHOB|nr:ATPase, T2SS/T4P/T4SS family [Paracoccus cavernae]